MHSIGVWCLVFSFVTCFSMDSHHSLGEKGNQWQRAIQLLLQLRMERLEEDGGFTSCGWSLLSWRAKHVGLGLTFIRGDAYLLCFMFSLKVRVRGIWWSTNTMIVQSSVLFSLLCFHFTQDNTYCVWFEINPTFVKGEWFDPIFKGRYFHPNPRNLTLTKQNHRHSPSPTCLITFHFATRTWSVARPAESQRCHWFFFSFFFFLKWILNTWYSDWHRR